MLVCSVCLIGANHTLHHSKTLAGTRKGGARMGTQWGTPWGPVGIPMRATYPANCDILQTTHLSMFYYVLMCFSMFSV